MCFKKGMFVIDEITATVQTGILSDNKGKSRSWKNCHQDGSLVHSGFCFSPSSSQFSLSSPFLCVYLLLLNVFQDAEIQFLAFPSYCLDSENSERLVGRKGKDD